MKYVCPLETHCELCRKLALDVASRGFYTYRLLLPDSWSEHIVVACRKHEGSSVAK